MIRIVTMFLFISTLLVRPAYAQEVVSVQVKTFDEKLKPLPDIRLSINNKITVATGSKGNAYADVDPQDLPPTSIVIEGNEYEAGSWNYSRGTLEIIIRKKTYKVVEVIFHDEENKPIVNTPVSYSGARQEEKSTDRNGVLKLLLRPNEKLSSTTGFSIPDYTPLKLQAQGEKYLIVARSAKRKVETKGKDATNPVAQDFKNFNLDHLDSIRSLTVFYAVFKHVQMGSLKEEDKSRIDRKFRELMIQLEDSIRNPRKRFLGKISDSSFVGEDIRNLVAQAEEEKETLDVLRESFEEKIRVLNEKLSGGTARLTPAERETLITDINRLEMILLVNEQKFYKNQSSYQHLLKSLKERFFDIEELENKLMLSETQRIEERDAFQKQIVMIATIALSIAVLCVMLVYFSTRLRKQQRQLLVANEEIRRINNNLEQLVSERTAMLKNANREMDTFLYKASHDLRGPICSIIGLCNLASRTVNTDALELVQMTYRTAFAMDRMLKKLKVISEINHPTNYSSVNIGEQITSAIHEYQQYIRENNVLVKIQCPPEAVIHSFPNLIEVIIYNLFENALHFSSVKYGNRPSIMINVTKTDDTLQLLVEDNGIGMAPAVQERIWDMFFVGNELSHGNGLGLYIVRKSVEVLKGTIEVTSVHNEFARFMITIPVENSGLVATPRVDQQLLVHA